MHGSRADAALHPVSPVTEEEIRDRIKTLNLAKWAGRATIVWGTIWFFGQLWLFWEWRHTYSLLIALLHAGLVAWIESMVRNAKRRIANYEEDLRVLHVERSL